MSALNMHLTSPLHVCDYEGDEQGKATALGPPAKDHPGTVALTPTDAFASGRCTMKSS